MVATKKMTHLEFIQKAYETLRKPGRNGVLYTGMHTVFTGFNEAFRKYFDADPVKVTGVYTGLVMDMGFYRRNREINPNSSFSVNG